MAAPSTTLTTGLNSFYLIQLIESLSQLEIGYNPDVDDINQDLVLQTASSVMRLSALILMGKTQH